MLKIGINGFGRIGRLVLRALLEKNEAELEVLAINDLGSLEQNIHLLKYDTVHGMLPFETSFRDNIANIGDQEIKFYNKRSPNEIPWEDHGIDIVLECTGIFTKAEDAKKHLKGSVRKVLISAPASNADITVVYGVNDKLLEKKHEIISNASCTTNCLAPVAKIINDNFEIEAGFMTTVHSFTSDQRILDGLHSDLRRARTASSSMIPTSTGAAKAVGLVLPELSGKLDGTAIRIPTPNVSMIDFTFYTKKNIDVANINAKIKEACLNSFKGIVQFNELPLVSIDFNHNSASSIFDAPQTQTTGENFGRILSWYDNEWGFSNRMIDVCKSLEQLL